MNKKLIYGKDKPRKISKLVKNINGEELSIGTKIFIAVDTIMLLFLLCLIYLVYGRNMTVYKIDNDYKFIGIDSNHIDKGDYIVILSDSMNVLGEVLDESDDKYIIYIRPDTVISMDKSYPVQKVLFKNSKKETISV